MRIQKMFLINRAPFEKIILDFEKSITILSGINGSGKTTILTHIVDSFYELAKEAFHNEFENISGKYYRVSSPLFSLNMADPSIVYIRYQKADGSFVDYIDARGNFTKEWYAKTICIPNAISFNSIESDLKRNNNNIKYWSVTDRETIEKFFDEYLFTYFPAYRYETPFFLNDPYKVQLSFSTNSHFLGYLTNPIEVTSDLPQIANWIMDIVLDNQLYGTTKQIQNNINALLSLMLKPKTGENVRIGIGRRNEGAARIEIISAQREKCIYPSVFSMSSGELSSLCLFGELLRQADNIGKNADNVSGIVLIDEIDKHQHIKIQKEILPKLLRIFPNIQFIVTSHSPFFNLGFADTTDANYQILNMDDHGIACSPQDNQLFQEVYDMLVAENQKYYEQYKRLSEKIAASSKPLIITEGKTDWKHIKSAQQRLNKSDLDVEYYEYETTLGDTYLAKLLLDYARIPQSRKIIGIFDRDNFSQIKEIKGIDSEEFVDLGNNVYAFAIPLVNSDIYGERISIEHYYERGDLLKQDSDGRRLFLGNEFFASGNSKDGQYTTKTSKIQNKVEVNGIIEDKVYKRDDLEQKHSVAMPKSDFADYIYKQDAFANDFSFKNFEVLFNVIAKIIAKINE